MLYQKRINRYQYCKVQSNTNILKSMHHMCDVSPSVDMFTYCGDDWYNDMCGDVCRSIWISTYCGDVYNMDIVWVGGGMVIECHVMPPHTKAVMAFSQQVLVPTSLPLRDLHFFSESHSLWEAPSWGSPELAWLILLCECGSSLECPCWPTGPGAALPSTAWGELCLTYG